MNFFDSHAHLTEQNAYENLDEIILRAKKVNVTKIINICLNQISLEEGILLTNKYDFIYLAAASSPQNVEREGELFFPIVEKAAEEKKIIAIGETGLDYFYEYSNKDIQKKFLKKHFELALRFNLPVIIHARDAFSDLFSITYDYKNTKVLIHCFTGNEKEATEAIDRGWFISFSGILTFRNNKSLRNILKNIPLDRILIETDSPLLSPQSKRGKKNEPANLIEIANCVAQIKNMNIEDIAQITYNNTIQFFSIS